MENELSNVDGPIEGALYITGVTGPFEILKVLKVEPGIVHIRIYKNKFDQVPGKIDLGSLMLGTIHDKDGFGVGHLPLSDQEFSSWKPRFLQSALVLPEELDGYEIWKTSKGGVWQ